VLATIQPVEKECNLISEMTLYSCSWLRTLVEDDIMTLQIKLESVILVLSCMKLLLDFQGVTRKEVTKSEITDLWIFLKFESKKEEE
jgi:hypothetical protein